jgi:hypothetical protein
MNSNSFRRFVGLHILYGATAENNEQWTPAWDLFPTDRRATANSWAAVAGYPSPLSPSRRMDCMRYALAEALKAVADGEGFLIVTGRGYKSVDKSLTWAAQEIRDSLAGGTDEQEELLSRYRNHLKIYIHNSDRLDEEPEEVDFFQLT